MAASDHDPSRPLHLDAKQDADRVVVLTPEDEDRFVRSCAWVVEATKLGISRDVWLRELHGLLSHVRAWAQKHSRLVKRAYATHRDAQVAIYVVPQAGRFDFDLSEKVTELDLEVAEKFQACPCDVLQMPDKPLAELEQLTGNHLAILIYGDGSAAQSQVAP